MEYKIEVELMVTESLLNIYEGIAKIRGITVEDVMQEELIKAVS
ncbi:hypothetical protein S140_194 [Shewanella sp. phage 1/40]|nr:hypothetical protein S140_194 [Shewanella sp. phage 1/40]AHK11601.1 hypothetical protein S140_194 [Shewanella sp. phage 1/40]